MRRTCAIDRQQVNARRDVRKTCDPRDVQTASYQFAIGSHCSGEIAPDNPVCSIAIWWWRQARGSNTRLSNGQESWLIVLNQRTSNHTAARIFRRCQPGLQAAISLNDRYMNAKMHRRTPVLGRERLRAHCCSQVDSLAPGGPSVTKKAAQSTSRPSGNRFGVRKCDNTET